MGWGGKRKDPFMSRAISGSQRDWAHQWPSQLGGCQHADSFSLPLFSLSIPTSLFLLSRATAVRAASPNTETSLAVWSQRKPLDRRFETVNDMDGLHREAHYSLRGSVCGRQARWR